MSYLYDICHVPFFFKKTACQKYFMQILSQKQKAQIVNLKNPDLDLIQRIHPECGFYGFMMCFWICPPKRRIRFWIRIWIFPKKKTHPKFCRLTAVREREKILETPRVSHFVIVVALCIPVPNCYNACRTLICNELEMDGRRTSKPNNKYHHHQEQRQ